MVSVAILMVSSMRIFVNKLVTSKDIKNLPYVFKNLLYVSNLPYIVP